MLEQEVLITKLKKLCVGKKIADLTSSFNPCSLDTIILEDGTEIALSGVGDDIFVEVWKPDEEEI